MDTEIVFDQVSHEYNVDTPLAVKALDNVSIEIPSQKVTAIIGHTGSGKSTLIQHLNVLLKPTEGTIRIDNRIVSSESKDRSLKSLRKKVGVVFQFPESQLFEETVLKDVMFGPLNFNVKSTEAESIAKKMLQLVKIDESLFNRSPFELSGGQMRRVAIAGVLALEPEVLVLDEPTAGLDPLGHHQMMEMFMRLQKKNKLTLILVTHQMDDVVKYADHVIVMENGTNIKEGTPVDVFDNKEWLERHQLGLPHSLAFIDRLLSDIHESKDVLDELPLTVKSLAKNIVKLKKKREQGGVIDE